MVEIAREVLSYDLGKNILFDKIDYGENSLILYTNTDKHKQIFYNIMHQATNANSILFYVSHKTNQLNFNFATRNFSFNILNEDVIYKLKIKLDKCFSEIEKKNKKMLLISDWSNADLNNCGIFLPFLETLIKKSKGLLVPGWKRKYKEISQKIPFTLVNAFETANLENEFVQQVINLHQRVYLLQENLSTFKLPIVSPSLKTVFPKFHVLPQEVLEKLTKDNLKLITLLLLEESGKSGYQVLKEIASHFHCILSQGTLYPLLYQLEKESKIIKQNGKGREVIYSLTKETKNQLKSKKETCLKAYQHLASFFDSWEGAMVKRG